MEKERGVLVHGGWGTIEFLPPGTKVTLGYKREKPFDASIKSVVRALPEMVRDPDTMRFLQVFMKQYGLENMPSILLGTVRRAGLMNLITIALNALRGDLSRGMELLPNLLLSVWDTFGDDQAIACGDDRVSFREFGKRVCRLANGLIDLGTKRGDAAPLMFYNKIEFMESVLGSWFGGMVCPLINWHLKGKELVDAINRSNPKVLVVDGEFVDIILGIKDELKTIEHYIVTGERVPDGWIAYEDLMARSSDKQPPAERFIFGANIVTGGTTGRPKSVAQYEAFDFVTGKGGRAPHGIDDLGELLHLFIKGFSWPHYLGAGRYKLKGLSMGPLYHGMPFQAALNFVLFAASFAMVPRFDPEEVLRTIERERLTTTTAVPTHLHRLIKLPEDVKRKYDLRSMQSVTSCGGPCPVSVKRGINELFMNQGCKEPVFHEYYNNIEAGVQIAYLEPKDYIEKPERYASVGKIIGGDACIVDETTNEVLPFYKGGRFCERCLGTALFHYTKETAVDLTEDNVTLKGKEFYFPGDIGYLDEDTFLYLTSREGGEIKVGGVSVFPFHIEDVLFRNKRIADAMVIAGPDEEYGEIPVAIIQLEKGEKMSEEEVIEHCKREGIKGLDVPKKVIFTDNIGRQEDGKLARRKVKERFINKL